MRGATFILVNFKLHLQSEFPSDSIDKNGRIWNAKWMGKRDVIRCERDVTGIKWRCEPLSVPSMQQTKSTKQHKEHTQIIKQSGGQKNTRLQDLQWRKDIHKQQSMSMKKQEDKEAHTHTFYSKQRHSRNTMLFLVIFWFCEIPYIAQHWGFQLHQPPQLQNRQKKHIFSLENPLMVAFCWSFPHFPQTNLTFWYILRLVIAHPPENLSIWPFVIFCFMFLQKWDVHTGWGPPVMWTLVGLQPHLN